MVRTRSISGGIRSFLAPRIEGSCCGDSDVVGSSVAGGLWVDHCRCCIQQGMAVNISWRSSSAIIGRNFGNICRIFTILGSVDRGVCRCDSGVANFGILSGLEVDCCCFILRAHIDWGTGCVIIGQNLVNIWRNLILLGAVNR